MCLTFALRVDVTKEAVAAGVISDFFTVKVADLLFGLFGCGSPLFSVLLALWVAGGAIEIIL